ncbi:type I glyceraldehyde-3-phosphate dehydrogenase [Patescibacteria group bacterium]|nr:type I glyceraldehyde-3-phosphate dehydrogenase [Patescibacteria group bacterium]
MIKVAINGFGRIGRIAFRVARTHYKKKVKIVAVNTSGSMDAQGWAHMLKYDSVYGRFKESFKVETKKTKGNEISAFVFAKERIPVLAQRDPAKIPWEKYKVDVVIEATGVFTKGIDAKKHVLAGAQKVVISAPSEDTPSFVIGVNEDKYRGTVINNASCTTNCVAPVTKIIWENFGIEKAMMSTIHAYTSSQELVDGSSKSLRRARAAAINIVPTTTGAARATVRVIPEIAGLFDGLAYRVPVASGSIADFVFLVTKRTTVEEVNQVFRKAAKGKYKGIVEVTEEPLVSTDILGTTASAIVDLNLTAVVDHDLVKIVAWYDNEWGYCCRLIEEAILVGGGKR